MGFLLRFSHAGTNEALALPALKRLIRVETLHRALKRSFPRINAGASRTILDKTLPA